MSLSYIPRYPKMGIKSATIYPSNFLNAVELSFILTHNDDLFDQLAITIINVVELNEKFPPDSFSTEQLKILKNIRKELQMYLIKNL